MKQEHVSLLAWSVAGLLVIAAPLGIGGSARSTDQDSLPDLAAIMFSPPADHKGDEGLFYRNPVLDTGADPSVIKASDEMYYLYPTGGSGLPVYASQDLTNWDDAGMALRPEDVAWGGTRNFWAPAALAYGGTYYLFYSAEGPDGWKHISVATSDTPAGPFQDRLQRPLLDFRFNTIDPHVLIDGDGKVYMYYVHTGYPIDGFRANVIFGAKLRPGLLKSIADGTYDPRDGVFETPPRLLLKPDQTWEFQKGFINEAPFVLRRDGLYYMTYSANWFDVKSYGVGYAVSTSPLGPFEKYADNPILRADQPEVSGTGHNSIVPSPDGTELFMVYHSHIDPDVGGGRRQVNIDRMGFDAAGSMYVDGPTLGLRPLPAGATLWEDIASEAEVTHGSERATVRLSWSDPRVITTIVLFGGASLAGQTGSLLLESSNGIRKIRFPDDPHAPAVVDIPVTQVRWLEFQADVPVPAPRVQVLGLPKLQSLAVALNGQTVFKGREWPLRLIPPESAVMLGVNELVVTMVEAMGARKRRSFTFERHPISIRAPAEYGGSIAGSFPVQLGAAVPPAEIESAFLRLTRVVAAVEHSDHLLYSGAHLPRQVMLDTFAFEDGAYDLVAGLITSDGTRHEAVQRVVIDNWDLLEDPLLAPRDTGWFGVVDRTKVANKSDGWVHLEGEPDRFFGDGDRLAAVGPGDQYLTWEFSRIHAFTFTLYARDAGVGVTISASSNGTNWHSVPFCTRVADSPATTEWTKQVLEGMVPEGTEWIRFAVEGGDTSQLGHVVLKRSNGSSRIPNTGRVSMCT